MIVWGLLIEAPPAVVVAVSVAAIVASMVVTPGPGQARESFSMLTRCSSFRDRPDSRA